jgi:beta-phosphoglucomutase-like phosphatase (HAD superfamily)
MFDFNGTLSEDEPLLLSIYQQLFARHGRPPASPRTRSSAAGSASTGLSLPCS